MHRTCSVGAGGGGDAAGVVSEATGSDKILYDLMTGRTAQTNQPARQQFPMFARSWETGIPTRILGQPEAAFLLKMRQNFTLAKFVVDEQYGSIEVTSTKV